MLAWVRPASHVGQHCDSLHVPWRLLPAPSLLCICKIKHVIIPKEITCLLPSLLLSPPPRLLSSFPPFLFLLSHSSPLLHKPCLTFTYPAALDHLPWRKFELWLVDWNLLLQLVNMQPSNTEFSLLSQHLHVKIYWSQQNKWETRTSVQVKAGTLSLQH